MQIDKFRYRIAGGQRFLCDRWVGLMGAGLALLHLVLTWRLMGQTDQVVITALFWLAILGMLMGQSGKAKGHPLSRYIGLAFLGVIVARSVATPPDEAWFVRSFPALAVLNLGLLISGFRLQQHWRAGLLVMPLMVPRTLVERVAEQWIGYPSQLLTAQFAAFVLHYLGIDAIQQNTTITLGQGAVEVLFRCTGIPLFILLLQLGFLFLIVFPTPRGQQIKLVIIAGAIAFLLSSLRVALMAVVVKDPVAFEYWHGGNGAQIVSTGAIVLFGWFCQQSLPRIEID